MSGNVESTLSPQQNGPISPEVNEVVDMINLDQNGINGGGPDAEHTSDSEATDSVQNGLNGENVTSSDNEAIVPLQNGANAPPQMGEQIGNNVHPVHYYESDSDIQGDEIVLDAQYHPNNNSGSSSDEESVLDLYYSDLSMDESNSSDNVSMLERKRMNRIGRGHNSQCSCESSDMEVDNSHLSADEAVEQGNEAEVPNQDNAQLNGNDDNENDYAVFDMLFGDEIYQDDIFLDDDNSDDEN